MQNLALFQPFRLQVCLVRFFRSARPAGHPADDLSQFEPVDSAQVSAFQPFSLHQILHHSNSHPVLFGISDEFPDLRIAR